VKCDLYIVIIITFICITQIIKIFVCDISCRFCGLAIGKFQQILLNTRYVQLKHITGFKLFTMLYSWHIFNSLNDYSNYIREGKLATRERKEGIFVNVGYQSFDIYSIK